MKKIFFSLLFILFLHPICIILENNNEKKSEIEIVLKNNEHDLSAANQNSHD